MFLGPCTSRNKGCLLQSSHIVINMSPTGEGAVSLSLEKVHIGVGAGDAGWWEHAERWAGAGGRPRPGASAGGRPAVRGTQPV